MTGNQKFERTSIIVADGDETVMYILLRSEDRLDTWKSVDSIAIAGDGADIDGGRTQRGGVKDDCWEKF